MKKPKKEDYGWQEGGIWDETGWLLEGGEDAYLEALSRWEAMKIELNAITFD